jgi:hypothetical protein
MMRIRVIALALVASLVAAFVISPIGAPVSAQPGQNEPGLVLPNVTGSILQGGQAVGQLTDGTLTITRLQERGGQLIADGTLTGTVQGQPVTQAFRDVPLTLADQNGGACDILNLDLGPINLDLLGLVVDLSPVSLDVTAVPGPGNLLGNLLCAVVGLLDQGPAGGQGGILNQLLSIINRLLGGQG